MLKQFSMTFALAAVAFTAQTQFASAQTIVDIAVNDEEQRFESLVDAVTAQGLAETLSGEGSFTVFAPTDDAFAAIPGYIGDVLAENPDLLTNILLYHVVGEELFAEDVLGMKKIDTLEGGKLEVSATDDGAFVNHAQILLTDIDATNGVVHVIDTVMIPKVVYVEVLKNLQGKLDAMLGASGKKRY